MVGDVLSPALLLDLLVLQALDLIPLLQNRVPWIQSAKYGQGDDAGRQCEQFRQTLESSKVEKERGTSCDYAYVYRSRLTYL